MKKFYLLLITFFLLINTVQAQPKLKAEKKGDQIDVYIGNKFFTSYIFSPTEKYPFFFPVNGPSGATVTSMRNGQYPHHSSLFFGCDKVNGGNYWQEGLDRGQIISLRAEITEATGDKIVLKDECIWTRPGAEAPIKDIRKITISAPEDGVCQLDFAIRMQMLMDVTIEKTNHSLFSVRVDPDLAVINGGNMVNAEGDKGEKATFGKSSPWMDYYGIRGEAKEGIAILQHPENKWFPAPWFTRDYGFFSPTPMYWPENEDSISISKGDTIRLKYRVLVHKGDTEEAGIAQFYQQWKTEK